MTPATDAISRRGAARLGTTLGYPLASAVVGEARDQDGRGMTGRGEDRAR